MPVQKFSVTVAVDDLECKLSLADFTDGGAALLANLETRAANVAQQAAKMVLEQLRGEPLSVTPASSNHSTDDLCTPPLGCSGKADCNCEACQAADAADRAQRPDGYAE